MKKAQILVHGVRAAILEKQDEGYRFIYEPNYEGPPVSLAMPLKNSEYVFDQFPPFFEGLLPEGDTLEALLRKYKLDRKDYFGQLMRVGQDLVGAVTVEEIE